VSTATSRPRAKPASCAHLQGVEQFVGDGVGRQRLRPGEGHPVLKADGYKMGSDGFFSKNGKELSLTVIPTGLLRWVADMQVVSNSSPRSASRSPSTAPPRRTSRRRLERTVQLAYDVETGSVRRRSTRCASVVLEETPPLSVRRRRRMGRFSSPAVDAL